NVIAHDQPRRIGPLLVIERILAAGDFAPAGKAVGDHLCDNNLPLGGAAETGFEEMHQRHADFAEHDPFYSHMPRRYLHSSSPRSNPMRARPFEKYRRNSSLIRA